MDVFDVGWFAVFMDDQGTPISAWKPNEFAGSEVVNDVGSFCWNELASADLAASDRFYGSVFGWTRGAESSDSGSLYEVDGTLVCGGHTAGEGEPPFWSVWFTVADCDASVARSVELGATVVMPPNDMSFGRGAVVIDPQGAAVGLAAMDQPDP
jgi:predicted enzyme related to lactoylglutathione lyase